MRRAESRNVSIPSGQEQLIVIASPRTIQLYDRVTSFNLVADRTLLYHQTELESELRSFARLLLC